MNVPRVVVADLWSYGGKTTVATGLMGALVKKGLNVQAFKSGPDQVDAAYHTAVTKKPSRHLDAWLTSPAAVLEIFERSAKQADIAVIEGGMGLFDGMTWRSWLTLRYTSTLLCGEKLTVKQRGWRRTSTIFWVKTTLSSPLSCQFFSGCSYQSS